MRPVGQERQRRHQWLVKMQDVERPLPFGRRDPARLMWRDDVGNGGAVPVEVGDQRACRRLHRHDLAAA